MSSKSNKTDWKRLKKMSDEDIDCSDIPDLSNFNWSEADIILPEAKTRITMRIDTDVYKFFRAKGPKYQSRINAVLRNYMQHQLPMAGKALKKRAG